MGKGKERFGEWLRSARRRRSLRAWTRKHEREKRRDVRRILRDDGEWDGERMLAFIRAKLKWMIEYNEGPFCDFLKGTDDWAQSIGEMREAYALACSLDDSYHGLPKDRPCYGDGIGCDALRALPEKEQIRRMLDADAKEAADRLRLFALLGEHLYDWWS